MTKHMSHQRHTHTQGLDFEHCYLTDREAAVVQRMREGLTNTQIGRSLGIAERTVAAHLRNATAKTKERAASAGGGGECGVDELTSFIERQLLAYGMCLDTQAERHRIALHLAGNLLQIAMLRRRERE